VLGVTLQRPCAPTLAGRLFASQRLPLLRAAWSAAVGPELARRTQVLAIEGHALRVRVPDAGWRKVLHRMQPELLARLRALAGELAPRALGFSEGAPTLAAAAPVPRLAPVPGPLPAELAAAAGQIADLELRQRFIESAARYLASAHAARDAAVAASSRSRVTRG
jgi:hypothetical protein